MVLKGEAEGPGLGILVHLMPGSVWGCANNGLSAAMMIPAETSIRM